MQSLQGLFGLAKRLFDVDIEPADGQVPVWHEDVRFFCVKKVGSTLDSLVEGKWADEPVEKNALLQPHVRLCRRASLQI